MAWPYVRANDRTRAPRTETMPDRDDASLVAVAQVDPLAFAALYDRYVRPIYHYCYLRLGSHEAAEDATSETFLKALAALGRYRHRSFSSWLFRIAHNVVVDTQRRHRDAVPLMQAHTLPDSDESPEGQAIRAAERAAVLAALATLPREQRAAVELRYAGWSGEQIAAVLERTPAAVKMLRARGLARLCTLLVVPKD
jgi:RNA polymerase sigma-70 factor (ECF subfamily)